MNRNAVSGGRGVHGLLLALVVVVVATANPVLADGDAETITLTDFELGDVSSWSDQVGGIDPPFPDAFRLTEFALRDPHILVELLALGCTDVTDDDVPVINLTSVNGQVANSIVEDADSDGCLDFSSMLLFRPLDQSNDGERLDARAGRCVPPANATSCSVDASTDIKARTTVDNVVAGNPCLGVLAGTSSGYSPAIGEPVGNCFVSQPVDTEVELLGELRVPLRDSQVAAVFDTDPAQQVSQGLMRGFLLESDAAMLTLPAEIPVIGGLPLTVVLPGGSGNCSLQDDRDVHEGQMGWWFYFNFTAERVPWTGL